MTLFKYRNIEFKLNPLLVMTILIYGYLGYISEVLIIGITLLIHETTHIAMAVKLGIKISELEIFPFGGCAKLDCIIGPDPKLEVLVSIVGPITNLLLALILKFIQIHTIDNDYMNFFILSNITMGVFNLLPIFPLDGGRVLRGLLAYRLGFRTATSLLTYLSYSTSVLISVGGIFLYMVQGVGLYTVVIAIFISIAATKERKMAAFIFIKEIADKKAELIKKGIMRPQHLIVLNYITVDKVLKSFLPKKYHIIIVVDKKGKTLGTINESELLEGILKNGLTIKVESLLFQHEKC